MTARVWVTVGFALLAAFLYAVSNVVEQHEAEQIPDEHSLHASLVLRLARRPLWVLGFAADAGGYVANAIALGLGSVVFVQPILSTGLLMSLGLSTVLHHKHLGRRDWLAALLLCIGLVLFLVEVSPTGGSPTVDAKSALIWVPIIVVSMGLCLAAARRAPRPARAALMATAASIAFAASAVLTKAFVHYLGLGVFAWIPHWEPYALAVVTPFGFVVAQSSFQVGNLPASVAALEATGPVAAVILGIGMLDESVASGSPREVAAVVIAMIAITFGILVLAGADRRTPGSRGPDQENRSGEAGGRREGA